MLNQRLMVRQLVALVVCCVVPWMARAQKETLEYAVSPGDTLSSIVERYLTSPSSLEELRRLNKLASADLIQPGQRITIPRHLARYSLADAQLATLHCPPGGSDTSPDGRLRVGDRFREGQTVEIPKPCHAALVLPDKAMVRLAPGSSVRIHQMRRYPLESEHLIRMEVASGFADASVQTTARRLPLEIRTPKALAGVRGTEFRVGYSPEHETSTVEVWKGLVATRGSADTASQDLPAGFGAVVGADGVHRGAERLLSMPAVQHVALASSDGQPLVEMQAIEGAQAYRVETTAQVTPLGGTELGTFAAPRFTGVPASETATLYRIQALAPSGLSGLAADIALCSSTNAQRMPSCAVQFGLPRPVNTPARFKLELSDGYSGSQVIAATAISEGHERFTVTALKAGRYHWSAVYDFPASGGSEAQTQTLAGSFIVYPVRLP